MQQMTQILRQPAAVLKKDIRFSHMELLENARDGLYESIRTICTKQALTDISHVRGLEGSAKVLGKKVKTEDWNPLLHSIYHGHVRITKFLLSYFGPGPVEQMLYDPKHW